MYKCTKLFHNLTFFAEGLMVLLQTMGKAYSSLAQFNSKQAIDIFLELPAHHLNTGWVLSHLGRAHFELAEYNQVCMKQNYLCNFRKRNADKCVAKFDIIGCSNFKQIYLIMEVKNTQIGKILIH